MAGRDFGGKKAHETCANRVVMDLWAGHKPRTAPHEPRSIRPTQASFRSRSQVSARALRLSPSHGKRRMTASKAKIERSLAARGRPANWANEQEAAVLSGFSPMVFRQNVRDLESQGFPRVNPINGMRFIPAINDFWSSQIDSSPDFAAESDTDMDGRRVENFNVRKAQRRAS